MDDQEKQTETQSEEKQTAVVEVKPEPIQEPARIAEEPKTDLPEGCVKAY